MQKATVDNLPTKRRLPFTGIALAVLWVVFFANAFLVYLYHPNGAGDFGYYYRGGMRLADGLPLYTGINPSLDYVGPPLLVQVIAPIVAPLDIQSASIVWFVFNAALLIGCLLLLSRYLKTRQQQYILCGLAVFFNPLFNTFWIGQVTVVLLACTVGAWAAYREDRPLIAGVLLSLATWIKFYPGLLILYFMWKREWRVTAAAFVAGMLMLALQIIGVSWAEFYLYFTELLPELVVSGQLVVTHSNHSILGFFQKLFLERPFVIPLVESELLFNLGRYGTTIALLGASLWLTLRPAKLSDTPPQQYDFEYSLVMIVSLFLGSTLFIAGMISLLLTYTVFMMHWRSIHRKQRIGLVLAIGYVLINTHLFIILGILQPPSENELPALMLSTSFFGMLMTMLINMFILARIRPQANTT